MYSSYAILAVDLYKKRAPGFANLHESLFTMYQVLLLPSPPLSSPSMPPMAAAGCDGRQLGIGCGSLAVLRVREGWGGGWVAQPPGSCDGAVRGEETLGGGRRPEAEAACDQQS
eukprot:760622-Hanusia_phi.AAC.4